MLNHFKKEPALLFILIPLWLIITTACATGANENIYKTYPDFILIKTKTGDTFTSLAEKHLADPTAGWVIAEFNDIHEITPGKDLIIPLSPFKRGGLKSKAYQTIPIISYNNFTKSKTDKNSISEDLFEAQMKYLHDQDYKIITLDQLFDFLDYKTDLPEKSLAITIDNCWRSGFEIAYPILLKYGFKASFFVYTDAIGTKKALDWEQLSTISKNGFSIECQTKTNRDLTKPDKDDSFKTYYMNLEKELLFPKQLLQEKLKIECHYLAYPYGAANNLIISLTQKYGYRGALTLQRGSNPFFTNKYLLNRILISGDDDLTKFKEYLVIFQNKVL